MVHMLRQQERFLLECQSRFRFFRNAIDKILQLFRFENFKICFNAAVPSEPAVAS